MLMIDCYYDILTKVCSTAQRVICSSGEPYLVYIATAIIF